MRIQKLVVVFSAMINFELWKWQHDFFDKWCNTTAVQTLQLNIWLLNFDRLLILYNSLLHCLFSLVFSAYYNLPNSPFWPAKCVTMAKRVIIILLINFTTTPLKIICIKYVTWLNSWHFAMPPVVSLRNDIWETSTQIPHWLYFHMDYLLLVL